MNMNKLSLIVPVYNEEDAIPLYYESVKSNHFL